MFRATIIGSPSRAQLQRQAQRQPQIGGIEYADDQLGRRLAAQAAGDRIARDGLVERGRHEAVGAGQIEHAIEDVRRVR